MMLASQPVFALAQGLHHVAARLGCAHERIRDGAHFLDGGLDRRYGLAPSERPLEPARVLDLTKERAGREIERHQGVVAVARDDDFAVGRDVSSNSAARATVTNG